MALWKVREGGLGATARPGGAAETKPDAWPGWEDAAVGPDRLGDYLRDYEARMQRYAYENVSLYGHFGQGCLHCRIPFDLITPGGIAHFKAFMHDAAELVVRYGGSLSGEHGDGQARGPLLGIMFGEELVEAMRRFRRIWDPAGLMNPGKVIDSAPSPPTCGWAPTGTPPTRTTSTSTTPTTTAASSGPCCAASASASATPPRTTAG